MIAVSLKGLRGRKLRTALTALRDRPRRRNGERHVRPHRHDRQGVRQPDQPDLRRDGRPRHRQSRGHRASRASQPRRRAFPNGCSTTYALLPGVEVATANHPRRADEAHRQAGAGDRDRRRPPSPSASTSARALQRFNPTELIEGRWPSGPDEVVIDASTADQEGYRVGETIGVLAEGPSEEFQIAGVAQYGGVDSLGNATFAVFDVPTAQSLLDRRGELDEIFVGARNGVSDAAARARARSRPAGHRVEVQTGTEAARDGDGRGHRRSRMCSSTSCSPSPASRSSSAPSSSSTRSRSRSRSARASSPRCERIGASQPAGARLGRARVVRDRPPLLRDRARPSGLRSPTA